MGRRASLSRMIFRAIAAQSKNSKSSYSSINYPKYSKEPSRSYELFKMDFNNASRFTKLYFEETFYTRKIERYVTRNYRKYPIYSEWKRKTKIIEKSIKLTNDTLEDLLNNSDKLIRDHAYIIVEKIDDKTLYPSWFIKKYYEFERDDLIVNKEIKFSNFKNESNKEIEENKKIIQNLSNNIIDLEKKKALNQKLLKKYEAKLKRIENNKYLILKIVLTFGIILFLKRKKAEMITKLRINNYREYVEEINMKIESLNRDVGGKNLLISQIYEKITSKYEKLVNDKSKIISECEKKKNSVKKLVSDSEVIDEGFVLLKHFVGIEHFKVMGVYIIRNRELNKYYVGQSTDVYKRVTKEHFNGLKVRNYIFFEDYYNSKFDNKDELFEIKVIPVLDESQLNKMEKTMIEKYDSYNNGYNSTSGNN